MRKLDPQPSTLTLALGCSTRHTGNNLDFFRIDLDLNLLLIDINLDLNLLLIDINLDLRLLVVASAMFVLAETTETCVRQLAV